MLAQVRPYDRFNPIKWFVFSNRSFSRISSKVSLLCFRANWNNIKTDSNVDLFIFSDYLQTIYDLK